MRAFVLLVLFLVLAVAEEDDAVIAVSDVVHLYDDKSSSPVCQVGTRPKLHYISFNAYAGPRQKDVADNVTPTFYVSDPDKESFLFRMVIPEGAFTRLTECNVPNITHCYDVEIVNP